MIGPFQSEVDHTNEQILGFTDLCILFSHVMEELCSPKNVYRKEIPSIIHYTF